MNHIDDISSVARFFTIDEVNQRLPLVRAIVRDAVELKADIEERRERLTTLCERRPENNSSDSPYDEEVREMSRSVADDEQRLAEFEGELLELGGYLVDSATGLVEFPVILEGNTVWSSWLPEDEEVAFWRKPADAINTRRPLLQDVADVGSDGLEGSGADL